VIRVENRVRQKRGVPAEGLRCLPGKRVVEGSAISFAKELHEVINGSYGFIERDSDGIVTKKTEINAHLFGT
jgi:hypothetical protein